MNFKYRKAVFLDRDGTLNQDPGYLSHPDQMQLLPQVGIALKLLKDAGFLLVVVSNQSGVGRGLIDAKQLPAIHQRLDALLSAFGVRIDWYGLCFHHPDEHCDCRKPQPRLLLEAATALKIDCSQSYMVGDRESDILAGRNAQCRACVWIRSASECHQRVDWTATTLLDAAHWILDQEKNKE